MMTSANTSSLRVAVLAGGESAEREVSLRSGATVAAALASAGHQVVTIDPSRGDLAALDWRDFDACFIALHGGAGEDGRIQWQLERWGVPYTGSCPQACRRAMSKSASKQRFHEFGVPTPHHVLIDHHDSPAEIVARVEPLVYPVIVKPDGQGSSVGVTIAHSAAELLHAAAEALRYDVVAIVEPLVRGREFTVAVLDREPLPPIEIISPEPVFSYDAKYHSSLTEYAFDFEIAEENRAGLAQIAVTAAESLGTNGLVRVDFMLDHDGRPWVLEVNTIPGMTPRSLAPQAALRAGMDMVTLCDLLVRQCLAAAVVS